MEQLRWPTTHETSEYMKMRQAQNRAICKSNPNENWMAEKLKQTPFKWTRQSRWGYRLFDFWSHELGIAIEVDGPEHDPDYDSYRDEYNFRRSGIVVLRIANRDECWASMVVEALFLLGTWKDRRHLLKLDEGSKKHRRRLTTLPREPSLLSEYLEKTLGWQMP